MRWHAAEALLDAEDAGERRGNADGAAAIGADMERAHARCRGNRRAAAAAAGRHLRIPRIAGDAGQRRIGDAFPAALRRRGLAHEHRAALPPPRHPPRPLLPPPLPAPPPATAPPPPPPPP